MFHIAVHHLIVMLERQSAFSIAFLWQLHFFVFLYIFIICIVWMLDVFTSIKSVIIYMVSLSNVSLNFSIQFPERTLYFAENFKYQLHILRYFNRNTCPAKTYRLQKDRIFLFNTVHDDVLIVSIKIFFIISI